MIVSASQLRGVPKDRAELYGKPHVGARYVGNLCEHEPHDPALYGYGHWAITDTKTGRTIEITEG